MWGITMNVPKHFARKYVGGMAEVLSMDLAVVLAQSPQIEKDLGTQISSLVSILINLLTQVGPEDLMLGKWFADMDYPMGVMHDPRYINI